jgi:AmiR/NasT family two-component response regulator
MAPVLRQQLVEVGYDPVADTPTGEEAIVLAGQLRPDLVFMDIELAGTMDGISTAQILKQQFGLAVVYLTALSSETFLQRAKVTEAFGYIVKPFETRELRIIVEMALFKQQAEQALRKKNAELQAALDQVKALSGLLPICAGCKKIRDDKGYWNQVETYVEKHSEARFTHGLCPDCIRRVYPEFDQKGPGSP